MELYENCYEEQSNYCNEAIYVNDANHIEQNDQFEEEKSLEYLKYTFKEQSVETRQPEVLTFGRTRRCRTCCCCFVGFIIGCILTLSICLIVYFFLLPYLESLHHGTPNEKQRSACYKDWLVYSGSCYYFSNYSLSWDNAQENCAKMSSHLADISDEMEAKRLEQILEQYKNNDTWIGGRCNNSTECHWNYNDNSWSDMNFTNWAHGQPSFPEQSCVQMWQKQDYKWDDEFCYKFRQFICKRNK